jgi:metal-responsive CopG/Arc/MetJ family transcriptional regulator
MSYQANNVSLHPKVNLSLLDDLDEFCHNTFLSRRSAIIYIIRYHLSYSNRDLLRLKAVDKGNIKLHVHLPKDLIKDLDVIAKDINSSRNRLVVMMVSDYLAMSF